MKKLLSILFLTFAVITISSCEDEVEAPGTNYVTFESATYNFEVTPDGTTTKDVYVYSANITNADRTFTVNLLEDESSADASVYSIPTTVTIPAGTNAGIMSITGSDIDLDFATPQKVVLEIAHEEGLFIGEKMTINFLKECIYNKVFLNIEFDTYPDEVYWVITDDAGTTVAESLTPAGYGAYAGLSGSISQALCLTDGTYTFTIYDAYEDGAGAVTLSASDGTELFSTDGKYGAGTSGSFTLGGS